MPDTPMTRPPESPVISEIFLSPRVIDREAYNDFAASLRTMIEKASAQGDSLRTASDEAVVAREALREMAGKTTPRLEAAARVLATIDARAADAQASLAQVKQTADEITALRDKAAEALRTQISGLENHLARLSTLADEKLRLAETGSAAIIERYEQQLAGKFAQLEERQTHHHHTLTTLAELIDKAESLLEHAPGRPSPLRALIDKGESLGHTGEAIIASIERAQQHAAGVGERLDANVRAGTERLEQIEKTEGELRRSLTGMIDECRRLSEQAGRQRADLHAALDEPRAQLSRHARELSAGLEQTGLEIDRRARDAAQRIEQRGDELERRVRELTEALDSTSQQLETRRDAVLSTLDAPIARMQEQARAMHETLAAAGDRCDQARRSAADATAGAGAVVTRLSALMDELRPWKPALLEARPGGQLPEPLRLVIEQAKDEIRAEIGAELAEITSSMHAMLARAQRSLKPAHDPRQS